MNDESMDFWQQKVPAKKDEAPKMDAFLDEEAESMKLKLPKPVYEQPTKCEIVSAKFFKMQDKEKDRNGVEYTPFQLQVMYKEVDDGREFTETYRGGRVYIKDDKQSMYIGQKTALGRLKAVCIDNKLDIGLNISTWATNLTGKVVVLKADIVMFEGKKYDKNFVVAFAK